MSLIAKPTKSGPPIPAGTYSAVCYSVVDLGTHYNEYFGKSSHQVCITWEIPEVRIDVERDSEKVNLPRVTSKTYTLSLHEKSNLAKDLISWRGKPFTTEEADGFDVHTVAGASCILTLVHVQKNNTIYTNIASVAKPMAGMEKLTPENPVVHYSVTDDGVNIPESVPDWMKKIITSCEEFKAMENASENPELQQAQDEWNPKPNEDDIPF